MFNEKQLLHTRLTKNKEIHVGHIQYDGNVSMRLTHLCFLSIYKPLFHNNLTFTPLSITACLHSFCNRLVFALPYFISVSYRPFLSLSCQHLLFSNSHTRVWKLRTFSKHRSHDDAVIL